MLLRKFLSLLAISTACVLSGCGGAPETEVEPPPVMDEPMDDVEAPAPVSPNTTNAE